VNPLKLNVYVNDVEKTDTAGLQFSLATVNCSGGGGETPLPFVTTGGTVLRWAGDQFINHWKSPCRSGICYIVRMTTTADGGSISALFKTK
jgi:hypothetical protein